MKIFKHFDNKFSRRTTLKIIGASLLVSKAKANIFGRNSTSLNMEDLINGSDERLDENNNFCDHPFAITLNKDNTMAIKGILRDERGRPLRNAVVELWQPVNSNEVLKAEQTNEKRLHGYTTTDSDGKFNFQCITNTTCDNIGDEYSFILKVQKDRFETKHLLVQGTNHGRTSQDISNGVTFHNRIVDINKKVWIFDIPTELSTDIISVSDNKVIFLPIRLESLV